MGTVIGAAGKAMIVKAAWRAMGAPLPYFALWVTTALFATPIQRVDLRLRVEAQALLVVTRYRECGCIAGGWRDLGIQFEAPVFCEESARARHGSGQGLLANAVAHGDAEHETRKAHSVRRLRVWCDD